MKKTVLLFGCLCLGWMLIFRSGTYSLQLGTLDPDLMLGGVALLLFCPGAILYGKTVKQEIDKPVLRPGKQHNGPGLTDREYQVLIPGKSPITEAGSWRV